MAQFNPTVITNRGQSLLAKVEAGQTALNFTKVKTSNNQYPAGTDLAGLVTMTNQKQESLVSGVSFVSPASVLISSTFTNAELGEGYYVWAIGLFATDPQLGEILFSITTASTADYMPANNGVSVSSILCELVITTGNASNVNLNIDPAAVASMSDITNVRGEIEGVNFALETHEITNVNTEDGAHGIRYFDDKLWYWDGLSWAETSGGGGGGGGGIPPNNVSDLSIIIGNAQLTIKWSDPEDSNVEGVPVTWKGTKLIRKLGSYPTSITDGVLVIDNQDRNEFKEIGFIDTLLTNNQTYYYQLFPYSETNAINIDPENRISGEPQLYKTYGVRIDTTNSNPLTSVTYTDDAVGMNGGSSIWDTLPIFKNIKPCMLKNGVVQYYLNPNYFTRKADEAAADITSGNDGDVMIEIPKTGYSIVTSGNYLDVKITDDPSKAGFVYNAHTRVTAGDRNKLYIGAYLGSNESSKLRSLSGKKPYAAGTIGTCRTLAQANGSGYDQVSFYPLTLLQCLYMVKYKNLDSQNALGRGYVDSKNTAFKTTGGTNAKGMYFGETTGKQQMKFAGIEDFWGNLRWWFDGLFSDANRNIKTAFKDFNDTGANYTDQGQWATDNTNGYMGKCQGTNTRGFITKEASGSATTYFCDYADLYASCLPSFGGHWTDADRAGAFCLHVYYSASDSHAVIGARLMFL